MSLGLQLSLRFKHPHHILPAVVCGDYLGTSTRHFRPGGWGRGIAMVSNHHRLSSADSVEASRKVLKRFFRKKLGFLLLRARPRLWLTRKPLATRMGRGKGSKPRGWYVPIRPGWPIFEVYFRHQQPTGGFSSAGSRACALAGRKLGLRCRGLDFLLPG